MRLIHPGSSSSPEAQPVTGLTPATSLANDDNVVIITAAGETKTITGDKLSVGGGGGNVAPGNGSPEGVVTATPGAVYLQLDGPNNLWVKAIGTGNTGWAQITG